MPYVFGPVPSRRLGRSLGVDLIPLKTCSYDCIYCQVGRTTSKTAEPAVFHPVDVVLAEIEERLKDHTPDVITFSGSGEPTLHSGIHEVIQGIRKLTDTKIVVLTNGSLLWRPEVRERVGGADLVMPTLSTVHEKTFRKIHRPEPSLRLEDIIEGMVDFRKGYPGQIDLEVLLLKGLNDTDTELEDLRRTIERIEPDRIQLNTVVRPPSERYAMALDRDRLEEIRDFMGEKAEVVAFSTMEREPGRMADLARVVREMAERRPVRVRDVADSLGLDVKEAGIVVQGLVQEGGLSLREHEGDRYYIASKE